MIGDDVGGKDGWKEKEEEGKVVRFMDSLVFFMVVVLYKFGLEGIFNIFVIELVRRRDERKSCYLLVIFYLEVCWKEWLKFRGGY